MDFERLGFWGKRPFVNNGRFAYAKLVGAGNLRLPYGFWRLGFVGKRPFVRTAILFM